jgi:hypothetical protein
MSRSPSPPAAQASARRAGLVCQTPRPQCRRQRPVHPDLRRDGQMHHPQRRRRRRRAAERGAASGAGGAGGAGSRWSVVGPGDDAQARGGPFRGPERLSARGSPPRQGRPGVGRRRGKEGTRGEEAAEWWRRARCDGSGGGVGIGGEWNGVYADRGWRIEV